MDELEIARRTLAVNAGLAARLRRIGLERTRRGYEPYARARRVQRMEQIARIPRGVDRFHVLWPNKDGSTVTIEWSDGIRVYYAIVPKIAVQRHDRQAGRRKG
jgi:hypothetical protein